MYGILGLQKDCSDADIKKAYRKLALLYHPDKCSAPGTDEAFKAIGHAFAVLSDADKRSQYDRFGFDPESRAASSGPGRASAGQRHYGFERFDGELSPEDLFNLFFNGMAPGQGGFRSSHSSGPSFTFGTLGGEDPFRSRRRQQQRFRQQQQQEEAAAPNTFSRFLQLLPLIILLFSSVLSTMFTSFFSSPQVFSFTPTTHHQTRFETANRHVPFYVNRQAFSTYESSRSRRKALERDIEQQFLLNLRDRCANERREQQRRINMAQGWFHVDQDKLRRARNMKMHSCDELTKYFG